MREKLLKFFAKGTVGAVVWLALILVIGSVKFYQERNGAVLSISRDVQVTATVYACILQVTAIPEKRIPVINNWGTILEIAIYDLANDYKGTVTATTNNQGQAAVNICDQGLFLLDGDYNIYVRGFSHLRKLYPNTHTFEYIQNSLDFSNGGSVKLLAGETSNVFDNKINSLDLATQINQNIIFTSDYKNDLNQDGIVNSLDISNTLTNFFAEGE